LLRFPPDMQKVGQGLENRLTVYTMQINFQTIVSQFI